MGMLIQGTTIVLRDPVLGDLDALAFWLRADQEWHRWDGPYYPGPTPEGIRERIEDHREEIETGEFPDPRTSLVIAGRETDALLGHVTWYWQSRETNWLSVGIGLYDPATRGGGRGYQALGLWGEYLLASMPALPRLDLRTWSGNTGMMRLAGRLGFIEEARFRHAREVDGQLYDGLGFGILREEWTSLYPAGFAAHLGAPTSRG